MVTPILAQRQLQRKILSRLPRSPSAGHNGNSSRKSWIVRGSNFGDSAALRGFTVLFEAMVGGILYGSQNLWIDIQAYLIEKYPSGLRCGKCQL